MKARLKGREQEFFRVTNVALENHGGVYSPEDLEFIQDENMDYNEANKLKWISDTAVKLLASIPYDYVIKDAVGTSEPRHKYAARIAKEMADVIFG